MVKYDDLIGKPFDYWGRGPDRYDCWGLLMEMYRRNGIELPDYGSEHNRRIIHSMMFNAISRDWAQCERKPGCAVHLELLGLSCHVGYVISNTHFIHTMEQTAGVCVERLDNWGKRIRGYYEYIAN